ncbi:two-component regulator propeller domain-containing protein [Cytophaga sp. FL35]|uniref:ligand-binding sensor domain-containing protein n=1 Tax=Cytophaga sp. FL35 TaxID=1904456 RepID=UPI001653DDD8|nr:two-component regulator propeller domain-containing protein [Cytophaga sp. FL35]MBC7000373.1 helix-turn-helix domain-containing protein [Cytophaga sp. FL35]
MRRYSTLVLLFSLTTLFKVFGQEYPFKHLTTVDGLSHNEVRKIVKDSRGFLWFGTQNGLNRFDGYRFKQFKHIPNDSTTIVDNRIFSMAATKGKLWVGTVSGLSVLDVQSLAVVQTDRLAKELEGKNILQLFSDGEKTVWASTETHNYIIDTKSLTLQEILPGYRVVSLALGLNKQLWIATDKGILKFDSSTQKVISNYGLPDFNAYALDELYTNEYGEVWVTKGSKIYRYQSERERFLEVFEGKPMNAIAENGSGELFFGSYSGGLVNYSRKTGVLTTFVADPYKNTSISSNDVYDVFIDEEDVIWVGTQEGLDYFDPSRNRFQRIVQDPNNEQSLGSNFIQAIYQDEKGVFWLGTRDDGINTMRLDNANETPKINRLKFTDSVFKPLNNAYITFIHKDRKGRVWIGTMAQGTFLWNTKTGQKYRFTPKIKDSTSIASASVRTVLEDSKGQIWLGTAKGISRFVEKDSITPSFENFGENTTANGWDVYTLLEDEQHRIWIGSNRGGLGLLSQENGKVAIERFVHDPSNPNSLSNDEVFVLFQDARGHLWVGTSGGGLNLVVEHAENRISFKHFTDKNALLDNEVNAILEDDYGKLWVATNTGFSVIDSLMQRSSNYTTYDGVLKGKFRKNAQWKTKDGRLFFGGTAGINHFDPKDFILDTTVVTPLISELWIDGKEVRIGGQTDNDLVLSEPLDFGTTVELPNGKNRFELKLATTSYTSPNRNLFRYRLEGVDTDWKYTSGEQPEARYADLEVGSYHFKLEVGNSPGKWHKNSVPFIINVQKGNGNSITSLWYLFAGLSLLLVTCVIYFIRPFKSKKVELVEKPVLPTTIVTLSNEENEKIQELKDLMDKNKLYLSHDLSLGNLSEHLQISANQLSYLLNEHIGKNFYDFINHYRVEEVKQRLRDSSYKGQTLSSIGLDCGFNSKSTFNRIFKNATGLTPSEYQKENTVQC